MYNRGGERLTWEVGGRPKGAPFKADTTDIDRWWKTYGTRGIESHDGTYFGTRHRDATALK
jgi:hypothetical protein